MSKILTVQQGESLDFCFDRGGNSITGWTCQLTVKLRATSPISIQRNITPTNDKWKGYITKSESEGLDPGTYFMTAKLTNATTDQEEVIVDRLNVSPKYS